MLEITGGRLLTHAHDENNWRLRDMKYHPRDPNWETGQYTKCHEGFRTNPNLQPNTFVFDLVHVKERKSYVIRSAFLIKKIKRGTVYFDSYFYADGEPLEFPMEHSRTRYGDILTKKQTTDILEKITKNSYNEYKAGEKPNSIRGWDWERMKTAALTSSIEHTCH